MIDRQHLEHYLRLNGLNPTAPDEEIRSILISARWNDDDIDTAIMVLRENPQNKESHVDTYRRTFHTDDKLSPETVSKMLGIDMDVSSDEVAVRRHGRGHLSVPDILRLLGISITLSAISVLAAMWYFQIGIFHFTLQ